MISIWESNFVAGVVGATIGAIVSGVISYILQKQAFDQALAQRNKEKLEIDQALAMSLIIKLSRVITNLHGISSHLKDCDEKGQREKPPMARWQSFIPLANPPSQVNFLPEELAMLLRLKADNLFNTLSSADAVHNGMIEPLRHAAELKNEIRKQIDVVEVKGEKATHEFSKKTLLNIQPLALQLDAIIEQLGAEAIRSFKETTAALGELVKLSNEKLGTSMKTVLLKR